VRILTATDPAFVMGSTQAADTVDHAAAVRAGIEVVRRRSGGGGVLLVPGEHVWVDVWVPRGSEMWEDDVGRAALWLGSAWAAALDAGGLAGGRVHTGALVATPWSSRVCFAGTGPGEVTVGDRKAVGVSQRRTRDWIRLQTVVHRRWDAITTFALLADPDAAAAGAAHADAVVEVGDRDVIGRLAAVLPGV
jgi:lipoate-protein ligase A